MSSTAACVTAAYNNSNSAPAARRVRGYNPMGAPGGVGRPRNRKPHCSSENADEGDATSSLLRQLRQGRLGYRSVAMRPSPAALRKAAREAGAFNSTGQPLLLELQRPPSPLRFCTPLRCPDWEYTFAAASPTIGGAPLSCRPSSQQEQQQQQQGPSQMSAGSSQAKDSQEDDVEGEPPLIYLRKIRWMARSAAIPPHGPRSALHRMRDWAVLAEAAERDGNLEAAAAAHYSLGLLHEQRNKFGEALLHHTKFLKTAEAMQSRELQALAHNAKGVTLAALGWLDEAVTEHLLQLQFSDEAGQLVAHMNLGILLHRMGKEEEARRHLSVAADLGVELNDPLGHSLALGNLSVCAEPSGDVETSKRLLEEHLVRVQQEIERLAAHRPPAAPLQDARAVLQQDTKARRDHNLHLHLQQKQLQQEQQGGGSISVPKDDGSQSSSNSSTSGYPRESLGSDRPPVMPNSSDASGCLLRYSNDSPPGTTNSPAVSAAAAAAAHWIFGAAETEAPGEKSEELNGPASTKETRKGCLKTEAIASGKEQTQHVAAVYAKALLETAISHETTSAGKSAATHLGSEEAAKAAAAAACLVRDVVRKFQVGRQLRNVSEQHQEGVLCLPALHLEIPGPPPQEQQVDELQQQQKGERSQTVVRRQTKRRGVRFQDRVNRESCTSTRAQRESSIATEATQDLRFRRGSSRQRFLDSARRLSSLGVIEAAHLHHLARERAEGEDGSSSSSSSSSDSDGSVCDIYESDISLRLTDELAAAATVEAPQGPRKPQLSMIGRRSITAESISSRSGSYKSQPASGVEDAWSARWDTRRISVAESLVICGRSNLQHLSTATAEAGKYKKAVEQLAEVLALSEDAGEAEDREQARVAYGIVLGRARFGRRQQEILALLREQQPR